MVGTSSVAGSAVNDVKLWYQLAIHFSDTRMREAPSSKLED